MRECDFCGEKKPLTVETEPEHVYPEIRAICSSCVWRCVAKLEEHHRAGRDPVESPTVRVIARPA